MQVMRFTTFDLASPRRAQKKHIAPTDDPAAAWTAALALAPLGWALLVVLRSDPNYNRRQTYT